MNLKKRGLGRGLEALLADGAGKDDHGLLVGSESESERHAESQGASNTGIAIKATAAASEVVAKYQSVAENSRKRVRQIEELPDMPTASSDVEALSSVVRMLIEDVKRDNLVLLEEAETLLRLFDEFESIISDR